MIYLCLAHIFSQAVRKLQLSDGDGNSIDLLLYNLALKCFFAIELKTGAFSPQDVGQLRFYVTAVDKLIKRPEDNPTSARK